MTAKVMEKLLNSAPDNNSSDDSSDDGAQKKPAAKPAVNGKLPAAKTQESSDSDSSDQEQKPAQSETAEREDRERLEKELDITLTAKRTAHAAHYASFRLKWFESRQRPFETHSKLTRLKLDKYINAATANERIVREIFLGDAPSDRVLVLYGAGSKFMNVATFSGRKFRHDALLRQLRARRNFTVDMINEAYTSKACSACTARDGSYHRLKINHRLRRGVCPDCNGAPIDRDYNAARNILVNHQRSTLCRPCSATNDGGA